MSRVCTKCLQEKDLSNFHVVNGKLLAKCKPCQNAACREDHAKHRDARLENIRQYSKEYRNSPEGKKKREEYSKSDVGRELNRVSWNRYYQTEKGQITHQVKRSRRRAAKVENTLTVSEWREILADYDNRCAYCNTKGKMTQDHITALVNGGTHTKDNVIPACFSCNSSKKHTPLLVWMLQKPGEYYG